MTARTARDVLLKARWGEGLEGYLVIIKDRLSLSGRSIINGSSIRGIGRSYIEMDDSRIPFHRVLEIEHNGEIVWSRINRT